MRFSNFRALTVLLSPVGLFLLGLFFTEIADSDARWSASIMRLSHVRGRYRNVVSDLAGHRTPQDR
jgi:hypothetical protein